MRMPESLRRPAILASALLGLSVAVPAFAEPAPPVRAEVARAAPIPFANADVNPGEPVTRRDIDQTNAKVKLAYGALMAMWSDHFADMGVRFHAPQLLRYRGTVVTSCGVMPQGNAVYCPSRNSIFFDEVFIAGMAKQVGTELGTDGDMAAVGVIAHEVGHAVALQLGYASRFTYANEAAADCLAGAFARQSRFDGFLEKGDLEEAFLGMALAGDSHDEVVARDSRRGVRAALMSHGTREQRMQNFGAGLERGPSACLSHFDLN